MNSYTPKIRFKNFEKRWESYRLSEYSNYRRGSFPQPYGNKEWYGGDNAMPFVQVVDVLENLRLVADTKQKISTLAQPMSVYVPSDSVIVTLQGSIGRVAITQYDAYVDRTILIFEDYISQTNKEFWAYTIRNKFEIERQKAPGGTIKTITKEALSDFKVSIPNYSEQSAIGSLFSTLDDLLASYKDNLANYQSLKATMLSKMFPKARQTVPEIRFDGFEGEWEIRKLSEVSEVYDGTHQTPDYTESGVKFLSVENISTLESEKYISEEDFEKDFKVFPEFGDVLMTRIGSIGVPNIVKTNEKIAFYVSLALLKPKKKTNSLFMKSSIESNPFQEELWKKTLHIAFPKKINKNDISQSTIKCPSYEEQQAIGSYFSNLDNLINSYQEKISQLETLKKKLLQDMFI